MSTCSAGWPRSQLARARDSAQPPDPAAFLKWSSAKSQQNSRRLMPDVRSQRIPQAARSILVIEGGSCFSSILPSLVIFASSALSSAPTSMAKPVQ